MKLLSIILVIRYVFYMIGDGMGANQVLAAQMYQAQTGGEKALCMTQFPYSGQVTTYSSSNDITDSAAAGTCLASGHKTNNGRLGTGTDGKSVESIATILKQKNWGVGVMTSVAIDHATPGAFYAHVADRNDYYTIGTHLAYSKFDFFGGAGFHKPEDPSQWQVPNLYDLCESMGYKLAHGYQQGMDMAGNEDRLILLQKNDGIDRSRKSESIPYAIDRQEDDLTLAQITEVAIRHLSSRHERFFMMVEGGKIDYAGHGNDGATNVREVIDFDEAIKVVYSFYLQHPDETLIVVTADHETGGMALGNSDYTMNLPILQCQQISSWELGQQIRRLYTQYEKKLKWEMVRALFTQTLGFYDRITLTEEEDAMLKAAHKQLVSGKSKTYKTLYQDIDVLGGTAVKIINRKAKLGWTTYSHSASPVPVFAIGRGAEQFSGWHDNSEIAPLMLRLTE